MGADCVTTVVQNTATDCSWEAVFVPFFPPQFFLHHFCHVRRSILVLRCLKLAIFFVGLVFSQIFSSLQHSLVAALVLGLVRKESSKSNQPGSSLTRVNNQRGGWGSSLKWLTILKLDENGCKQSQLWEGSIPYSTSESSFKPLKMQLVQRSVTLWEARMLVQKCELIIHF